MYKKIKTNDGSYTLYNSKFDENYHSISGAVQESYHKFIFPCKILFSKQKISILDIGFGLGLNCFCTLFYISKISTEKKKVIFYSFENDIDLFNNLNEELYLNNDKNDNFDLSFIEFFLSKLKNKLNDINIKNNINDDENSFYIEYSYQNIDVKHYFFIGDVRKFNFENLNYDICYHDPFSFHNNLELWTYDFLKKIIKNLNFFFLTYSFSLPFLNSVNNLKLDLFEIDPIGRKTPSILAIKKSNFLNCFKFNLSVYKPLNDIYYKYLKSKSAICYFDKKFDLNNDQIKENRVELVSNSNLESLSKIKKTCKLSPK